jgi:CheY-like chemotaxis protein
VSDERILVVDDHPPNIKLLGAILEPRGYTVLPAASGADALALVADERPDLVLLDIVMPGIDGWEMLRRIHERHGPVRVIMFSGQVDERSAADAASAGAQGFLGKPFDPHDLIEQTKQLLPT